MITAQEYKEGIDGIKHWKDQMKTLEGFSDANLVRRFREGDQSAFDRIVKRYEKKVFALAYRMMGNEEEALDISQETFIRVYEKIHSFRGKSTLFTWIYRIVVNLSINALRKRKLRETLLSGLTTSPQCAMEWNPEQHIQSIDLSLQIDKAVEKLPPKQKIVFTLRQFNGLSYAEIAQILNRSVGAVKATHFHALRKLQVELADLQEE